MVFTAIQNLVLCKILSFVHKELNGLAPQYIYDLPTSLSQIRSLGITLFFKTVKYVLASIALPFDSLYC